MHVLTRICLQNWYLIDALDIDIKGATAFVGPTGAGKTSLQDAIQVVNQGNNQNRMNLNASASGRSERTVREYCLGMTGDPAEGGKPLRDSCESVIALVYRDEETDEPITFGIAMSARSSDTREEVLSRFILPGYAYTVQTAKRRVGSREVLLPWSDIASEMRRACPAMEEYKTSAEKFVTDMLKSMRVNGQAPNAKHFQRTFSNALAFKPIYDSTNFVREFVLEPEPLDIERVRTSIETWQGLEKIIIDVEAKLRRATRLSDRFRGWGRAKIKSEASRLKSAVADCRRLAHEVSGTGALFRKKNSELQLEKKTLLTRRQYVRELDEEYRSKQGLAQVGDEAARLKQIDIEGQWATKEQVELERRFEKLKTGLSMVAQLAPIEDIVTPRQANAVKAAKQALSFLPDGKQAIDSLRGRGADVQDLVDKALTIEGADTFFHERADAIAEDVRQLQAEVERLEAMVSNKGNGKSLLSHSATRFLEALEQRGLKPIPLCDVVEVSDPDWQDAIETLLGWGREAIIVEPQFLDEAYRIMHHNRDAFSGCTLVKTSATEKVSSRIASGSILEAVKTDNAHALAFMNIRIGTFIKAFSDEELKALDRGVMKSGKTTSGMGLSVQGALRQRMLGRTVQAETIETLRNDLIPMQQRLGKMRQTLRLLREAGRIIPSAMETLHQAKSAFDLEHEFRSVAAKLSGLNEARNKTMGKDAKDLLAELEGIRSDRVLYQREIEDEIEPAIERLQGEVAAARAKYDSAVEALKKALKERSKVWGDLSAIETQKLIQLDPEIDESTALVILRTIRSELKSGEADKKDVRQWLASVRNDNRLLSENAEAEMRREQVAAVRELSEYSINWQADVPEIGADNMTVGYVWVIGEKARLEGNELRKYKEACAKAGQEMKKMLKEDLLARLAEKLIKVHHRLSVLNSLLDKHRFTGQVYSLEASVNLAFQKMHDLAMKIGGQSDGGQNVSLDDAEVADAVAELESMIVGGDNARLLADYRQYFNFEIVMTGRDGGRTTLTTRAVKGSGGESQAPFYVLIAVSLASTYFPGHGAGRPSGMGLAMFDEAFNKLDVPNTQALLRFFRDMGLQLLIAGPEDKRATFTEVLDTIVLVNKALDGNAVYIDAEYPMQLAKDALGGINPDHIAQAKFKELGVAV